MGGRHEVAGVNRPGQKVIRARDRLCPAIGLLVAWSGLLASTVPNFGPIERITRNSTGLLAYGDQAIISANGRFVLFMSNDPTLEGQQGIPFPQVQWYLRDRELGTTELISRNAAGEPARYDRVPWLSLDDVGDLSDDGRFVVFSSFAVNLVPGTNVRQTRSFIVDRGQTPRTIRLIQEGFPDDTGGVQPSLDDRGSRAVFLTGPATAGGGSRIAVQELRTGTRRTIEVPGLTALSARATLSANGRWLAAPVDVAGHPGACAADFICRYQPAIIDLDSGEWSLLLPRPDGGPSNKDWGTVALSADGRIAAIATATGAAFSHPLLPENHPVVLLRFIDEGRTELGARLPSGVPPICSGFQGVGAPAISGDGRFLAFTTNCNNFPGQVASMQPQAYVLDRFRNVLALASSSSLGVPGDFGASLLDYIGPFPPISDPILSLSPNLSTDGRYIAFHSRSTNLADDAVPGVFTGNHTYVRELRFGNGASSPSAVPMLSTWSILVLASLLALAALSVGARARR